MKLYLCGPMAKLVHSEFFSPKSPAFNSANHSFGNIIFFSNFSKVSVLAVFKRFFNINNILLAQLKRSVFWFIFQGSICPVLVSFGQIFIALIKYVFNFNSANRPLINHFFTKPIWLHWAMNRVSKKFSHFIQRIFICNYKSYRRRSSVFVCFNRSVSAQPSRKPSYVCFGNIVELV